MFEMSISQSEGLEFGHSNFEFVSNSDIRISDFLPNNL
jgi:hypothetical protein